MGLRVRGLLAAGAMALAGSLLAFDLIAQMPQTRTIALRNIHTDDVVTVEYKRNGRYVPEALERINWVMRDWRRDEATRMDPALIDLLWEMHSELGSKEPINIISAFRSRATNNMLRKTVGGQASESRHILGKAADVQFPDVPLKHMRYAAMVRERGGVGYYPTSATPFIHVDTDRVRAWPRMPRFELALLFPNGRTQHKPADGSDISSDDVRTARARQPEVALQLASFHDMRRKPREPALMTALAPGANEVVFTPGPPVTQTSQAAATLAAATLFAAPQSPRLVAEPRIVDRPQRLTIKPTDDDRRKLTQLVALAAMPEIVTPALVAAPALAARPGAVGQEAKRRGHDAGVAGAGEVDGKPLGDGPFPRLAFLTAEGIDTLKGWSNGFNRAPAWDEDHPEEAAYRAFPLASFLTASASIDDPALTTMVHPDLSRTAEMFDTSGAGSLMRLRPATRVAQLLWSQDAGDKGVDLNRLSTATNVGAVPRPVAARRVQTEPAR